MMMKIWKSTRSVLNASKAGSQRQLFATNFSHQSQGIHHNVDAPFGKPEPKVTRQIPMEDPYEKSTTTTNRRGEEEDDDGGNLTGFAADKARIAVETAFDMGKTVAEGMEKSSSGVKDTTQKVKDTVVGNRDDEVEEHSNSSDGCYRNVDKHVEDLRRKAGGYDKRTNK